MSDRIAFSVPVSNPLPGGSPGAQERRAEPRRNCRAGAVVRCLARPGFRPDWAEVTDLAVDGVGLVLDRAAEPGQPLLVQLSRRGRHRAVARVARVVHAAPLPGWGWAVGCRFDQPLSGEDLAAAREATGLRAPEPAQPAAVPALQELHDRLKEEGISADTARVATALVGIARDKVTTGDESPLAAWVRQLALEVRQDGTALDDVPSPASPANGAVAGLVPLHAVALEADVP